MLEGSGYPAPGASFHIVVAAKAQLRVARCATPAVLAHSRASVRMPNFVSYGPGVLQTDKAPGHLPFPTIE